MRSFTPSPLHFLNDLPKPNDVCESPSSALVIYDSYHEQNSSFVKWLNLFGQSYSVQAGEDLKDILNFPNHVHKISEKISNKSRKALTVIAVGGGSVGDFAGFFASTYKRGVPLVHIPTTWLAAIDSAHGGKTALNIGGAKNQVGSFHFAEKIFICKNFFKTGFNQGQESSAPGVGELIKTALLAGSSLWTQLGSYSSLNLEAWWELLPKAIPVKYNIVSQDPFEDTSVRQVLNLGHSFGHILEKVFDWSHGECVLQGLYFCTAWSQHRGYLDLQLAKEIEHYLQNHSHKKTEVVSQKLSINEAKRLLLSDKKINKSQELDFVFLKKLGQPYVESVSVNSFMDELLRQGWLK